MDKSAASESAVGASDLFPAELWTHILGHCDRAAEWCLVASRVCRMWRAIVCQGQRAAGRVPTHRGPEACRMRLARHALSAGNALLFAWAINDSCASPLTARARASLWDLVAVSRSSACARVLVGAGMRPRCACGGPSTVKCDAMAIARRAAKTANVNMLAILCDQDVVPFACWGYYALWDAIEHGNIAVLDFMHDRGWIGANHPTPKCRVRIVVDKTALTWIGLAALMGRFDALKWLVAHQIDIDDLDMALVHTARDGHTPIVAWLCGRHHTQHFATAFAMSLKHKRYKALEGMLEFRREARVRYEADGDTLGEAVARAQKEVEVGSTDDRAAELVRRLLEP